MQNISNLKIEFSSKFDKKLRKLSPETIDTFKGALELFLENPDHETLRKHYLKEDYAGYQSINITSDYRAIFKEIKTQRQIVVKFYTIGTHEELYGK